MKLYKNIILSLALLISVALATLASVTPAHAAVTMYDNFFSVGNNTASKGAPAKAVDAAPQNIVEFFIRIRNTGNEDAKRVQVFASLPSASSTTLVTTANIRPNNPDRVNVQISDNATVNVTGGQPVGLRFLAGHTRFAGVTNKFNCPNACDINSEDILKGIEVGDVPAGQEVQVAFKAFLTEAASAPTAAPPAPPAPPAAGGTTINNNNTNTNTNTNTQTVNVNSPTAAPTAAPTAMPRSELKELPQTGLPLAAWGLSGLLPLGYKLRKFGKSNLTESGDPASLWIEKQTKGI